LLMLFYSNFSKTRSARRKGGRKSGAPFFPPVQTEWRTLFFISDGAFFPYLP
jgi:hypothetical protein